MIVNTIDRKDKVNFRFQFIKLANETILKCYNRIQHKYDVLIPPSILVGIAIKETWWGYNEFYGNTRSFFRIRGHRKPISATGRQLVRPYYFDEETGLITHGYDTVPEGHIAYRVFYKPSESVEELIAMLNNSEYKDAFANSLYTRDHIRILIKLLQHEEPAFQLNVEHHITANALRELDKIAYGQNGGYIYGRIWSELRRRYVPKLGTDGSKG